MIKHTDAAVYAEPELKPKVSGEPEVPGLAGVR